MDYRLSEEVLKRADQNTVIIRNAGANVYELKEALSAYKDIGEVIYMPHNDCAAMKLVYSVIKEGKKIDREIMQKLISPFKNTNFTLYKIWKGLMQKFNQEF